MLPAICFYVKTKAFPQRRISRFRGTGYALGFAYSLDYALSIFFGRSALCEISELHFLDYLREWDILCHVV